MAIICSNGWVTAWMARNLSNRSVPAASRGWLWTAMGTSSRSTTS